MVDHEWQKMIESRLFVLEALTTLSKSQSGHRYLVTDIGQKIFEFNPGFDEALAVQIASRAVAVRVKCMPDSKLTCAAPVNLEARVELFIVWTKEIQAANDHYDTEMPISKIHAKLRELGLMEV